MPSIPFTALGPPYAYLDPASGRTQAKRGRARTAIIVACPAPPAYVFILYAWAAYASTSAITEQVFLVSAQFPRLAQFAIESAGQQYLLYSHLVSEMDRRATRIPLVEGTHYTDDAKDQRIKESLEPLITQGRLFHQSHQVQLLQELDDYPSGATKDLLDACAGCVSLLPKPRTIHRATSSHDALRSYLQRAHVPDVERVLTRLAPRH